MDYKARSEYFRAIYERYRKAGHRSVRLKALLPIWRPWIRKRFRLTKETQQTKQKTAPFTACGWGSTLLKALAECVQELHRFPYEGTGQG